MDIGLSEEHRALRDAVRGWAARHVGTDALRAAAEALAIDTADRHSASHRFLNARCMTIAGDTTEVQLNIIGERLLGLPRDPEPPAKGR